MAAVHAPRDTCRRATRRRSRSLRGTCPTRGRRCRCGRRPRRRAFQVRKTGAYRRSESEPSRSASCTFDAGGARNLPSASARSRGRRGYRVAADPASLARGQSRNDRPGFQDWPSARGISARTPLPGNLVTEHQLVSGTKAKSSSAAPAPHPVACSRTQTHPFTTTPNRPLSCDATPRTTPRDDNRSCTRDQVWSNRRRQLRE